MVQRKTKTSGGKAVKNYKGLVYSILALALAACGGGGGGGSTPVTNATAAGVWHGTSSAGYTVDLIVLPNNQFATVFGTPAGGNGLYVAGFNTGSGTINGNSLTASINAYGVTGLSATGSVSATVATGSSIVGSITYSTGTTTTFNLTPLTGFNYNTPALLSTISGTWNGTLIAGDTGTSTVTVNSSTGAVSGITSSGCTFTGMITPQGAVNAYTTTLTTGGSPCANPNVTASGIAVTYPTTAGTTQLIAEATSGSFGAIFFAQR